MPSRKKKNDSPEVQTAVLASVNGTQLVARIERSDSTPATTQQAGSEPNPQSPAGTPDAPAESGHEGDQPGGDQLPGGWVGQRTLIRATLPRTEGELPPPRPIPEFTMHQRQPRGGQGFRGGGQGWGGRGGPRGNFSFGSGNGHSGADRNGNVNGNSGGFGSGHGHHHGGGPQSPGNDQGRPPGQGGKRHRHGKHRRPR